MTDPTKYARLALVVWGYRPMQRWRPEFVDANAYAEHLDPSFDPDTAPFVFIEPPHATFAFITTRTSFRWNAGTGSGARTIALDDFIQDRPPGDAELEAINAGARAIGWDLQAHDSPRWRLSHFPVPVSAFPEEHKGHGSSPGPFPKFVPGRPHGISLREVPEERKQATWKKIKEQVASGELKVVIGGIEPMSRVSPAPTAVVRRPPNPNFLPLVPNPGEEN